MTFGTDNVKINAASVTANDTQGNSWTITTVGTTSFTQQPTYSQVGASKKPAKSITFVGTLSESVNITNFSAKFGGFSGTAGTITLKVNDVAVGTGSLNASDDVIVTNTKAATGKTLTIEVTGIAKGVKCYELSYTYQTSSSPTITLSPETLSSFSYFVGRGPSAAQEFTLQGSNLTEGVTLSATGNYEISKTLEGEYSARLDYTTDEINEAQHVYVRLQAGLPAGIYDGTITASSNGAEEQTITLSGEVYQEFHLTFSAENGSVSAADANGAPITNCSAVAAGTTVTLTATAAEGYRFSSWTVENNVVSINDNNTFIMPTSDVNITANFVPRTPKTVTLHHGIGGNTTKTVTKYDDSTLGEFVEGEEAESVNGWSFAGWVKSYTSGTPSYINETEPVGETNDLYALYSKGTNTFELINDEAALEVGGVYMICNTYNTVSTFMNVQNGDFMNGIIGNTVVNNQFEYNVGKKFVLGEVEGAYTFADGDNYLSGTENTQNLVLSAGLTDFSKWSISFGNDNKVSISNQNTTNNFISYYANKKYFNCFTSSSYLYLYKQITDKEYSITPDAEKCHVTYDANGGSNPPTDPTEYAIGATVTVLGPGEMSREGHTFDCWSDMQDGNANEAILYEPEETFTISENTTLYAQWTTNSYSFVLNTSGNVLASLYVDGTELQDNDKIQFDKEVTVEVAVNPGYIYTVSVTNNNTQELVQVTNDKFTMPASDITVTVTERVNPFICATLDSETMMQFIPNTEKAYGYGYIKHVTSDGLLWVTNGFFQTKSNTISLGMIQIRERDNSGGVSYIKLPEFEGRIEKIVFSVTSASAITSNGETTPNKLYFQETATKDGEIIAQGGGDNTNSITISLSDKVYNTGYILASKSIRIWNIEVTYTPYNNFIQYDDNTPLPSEIPAGENIIISNNANMEVSELTIPSTSTVVVTSGSILNVTETLTNQGSANNLIIEDGGQLIVNNRGVMATFKKSIEAATPTAKTTEGGWYSIASPVNNVSISSVTNLVDNTAGTLYYNLYRYNETSSKWEAYNTTEHPDFTTLANGQGYLYRNNGMELSFSGEVNHGEVVVNLTNSATNNELKGFNLIGNPFGHNIYKGSGAAIDNNNLSEGFYYLTNNGAWQAGDGAKAITPKMGVLVQVTGEAFELTISDNNSQPNTRYANDNLQFIVSNNEYQDVAYAKFSKGYGLNKISHRNSEVPMLYIPQNGERYAIAMMSDNTEMFALNFKAATMGRYTLSYKAEGEFSYLHVIDRLTGDDVDMLLEGEYSFTASPKDNESRFIVRLAYKPDYSNEGNEVFVYQNGDEILVSGEGELQVFDATGRLVRNMSINGAKSLNISTQGMYIFRLVGNEVKTQKIVVR
ncbi:MAG: InlB B-repeat-containing protein [Candidatus Limimorpha sp.]